MKNKKVVAERDAKSHSPQKNSWHALRAAREKTAPEGGNFRSFPKMVRMKGLEPSRLAAHAPKILDSIATSLSYHESARI